MTDRGPLYDQNDTPEDVATLYSWANLHGAKYRDFSEARAQTREKARQRVQQAIEEEQARLQRQARAERAAEAQRSAEAVRLEEQNRQAEWAAQQSVPQTAQTTAQPAAEEAAWPPQAAWQVPEQDQPQPSQPQPQPSEPPQAPQQPAARQPVPPQRDYTTYVPPQPSWPGTASVQSAQVRENYEQAPSARQQPEQREIPTRPAWLTPERVEATGHAASQRPGEDTLQGSRDRLASRWYALRGVFEGVSAPPEAVPVAPPTRAPAVAVFSLAGGVGKTSLVATLGRALSSRGERVLLVDTAPYGLMPFFFGAHDQRPGVLRTFSPPGTSGDAPIQMVTIDPDTLGPETAAQEVLSSEIMKYSRGVSRVVVDLATASGATTRRVLRMSPLVLVPMVPDMNSVVSVSSIDSFFQHNINPNSKQLMPFYILNQFDPSQPLHLDIREILREQLGDRLLTIALRRTPAVSEALAEGMTVMDYAPNSTVAEDFANLAGWVKSQSAPASSAYRGVRWSER